MDNPMMKCGCVASAVRTATNGVQHDPIPSCLVHDCVDVAESAPDLAGRYADCSYSPRGHAKVASSMKLAFFKYRGPGSPAATEYCKCGYHIIPHWPTWEATIKVVRRWYKHERYEDIITKSRGCPDEETAKRWANKEADFFRTQTGGKHHKETEVYSADIVSLTKKAPMKNHPFIARGPHETDEYYCGCMGWD